MNHEINTGIDAHIYDMSAHDVSVTHWDSNGEDRYTVRVANVVFYLSGDDFRDFFAPKVKRALKNPKTV